MVQTFLSRTDLRGFARLFKEGKVRDIYDLDEHLLIITTDRISAFDVVLPAGIPGKGKVLTLMSSFWFNWIDCIKDELPDITTHFLSADWEEIVALYPKLEPFSEQLRNRSMLVIKANKVLPVEAVVRGYLCGSGWRDYQETGATSGVKLPSGMRQAEKLSEPIFTPATKAETGHDENIDWKTTVQILGQGTASRIRDVSLALYQRASEYAEKRGIIILDTKFEFGVWKGRIILIDEVLTPDSSRFVLAEEWKPGGLQPSLDKQFVRDHLQGLVDNGKWDKTPPGPRLPLKIIEGTSQRYQQAFEMLTN